MVKRALVLCTLLLACGGDDSTGRDVETDVDTTEVEAEVVDTSLVPGATALPGPAVPVPVRIAAAGDERVVSAAFLGAPSP